VLQEYTFGLPDTLNPSRITEGTFAQLEPVSIVVVPVPGSLVSKIADELAGWEVVAARITNANVLTVFRTRQAICATIELLIRDRPVKNPACRLVLFHFTAPQHD
jgi:hypothetical protein